jgi:hypothetical protein
VQTAKDYLAKGDTFSLILHIRRLQQAVSMAARMMQSTGSVNIEKDQNAICHVMTHWQENDGFGASRAEICQRIHNRWNPPYIQLLSDTVLCNILGRVDMTAAMSCFRTCKRFREKMFEVLGWKAIALSESTRRETISLQGIDTLPSELLIHIFTSLDTYTLQSCAATCRQWRRILVDTPTVWTENVRLGQDSLAVERQWHKFQQLTKGKGVTSITMDGQRDFQDRISESQFLCSFPHTSLQQMTYYGGNNTVFDRDLWDSLLNCDRLKVIHFEVCSQSSGVKIEVPRNCELAKCKLDELSLSCPGPYTTRQPNSAQHAICCQANPHRRFSNN